jgi:HK97 gp10 family phage protein
MTIEILGLPELQGRLDKIARESPEAFKRGLLKGAYMLMRASMQYAPVRTGFLRDSHEVVETLEGAEMHVNADYAFYVEFGTSKMEAQPYVRLAISSESDAIVAAVSTEAKSVL